MQQWIIVNNFSQTVLNATNTCTGNHRTSCEIRGNTLLFLILIALMWKKSLKYALNSLHLSSGFQKFYLIL